MTIAMMPANRIMDAFRRAVNRGGRHRIELDVSPELAQALIDEASEHFQNRTVTAHHVRSIASSYAAGEVFQDAPIRIEAERKIAVDGNHRLHAVVRAGATVRLEFEFGFPHADIEKLDRTKTRSTSDVLRMYYGWNNVAAVSAIARSIAMGVYGLSRGSISGAQANAILTAFREGVDFAVGIPRTPSGKRLLNSGVLAAIAVAHHMAPAKVSEFVDGYITGTMLPEGDPRLVLAVRVRALSVGNGGMAQYYGFCLAARAIDAWLKGEKLKRLLAVSATTQETPADTTAAIKRFVHGIPDPLVAGQSVIRP